MKNKFFIFLALILAMVSANAQGIDIPVSFKANFLQQVTNTKGKVIKYRGKIYFNSPSNTKWVYNSPTRKVVCSISKKLTVIDHDLEQVSYYSIDRGLNLAKVLRKARQYRGRTYTTKYKGKLYTIVINSKNQIEQIAYKDNLDNTVNLIFTSIKYRNKPFSNSKFICPRPKNYDTIY